MLEDEGLNTDLAILNYVKDEKICINTIETKYSFANSDYYISDLDTLINLVLLIVLISFFHYIFYKDNINMYYKRYKYKIQDMPMIKYFVYENY